MWEQRADSKKKLKPNAVPTLFGFFLKKEMPITENKNNEVLSSNMLTNNDANENDNVPDKSSDNQSINNINQDKECEVSIKKRCNRKFFYLYLYNQYLYKYLNINIMKNFFPDNYEYF